jgi:multiple sugar transport system permease protein
MGSAAAMSYVLTLFLILLSIAVFWLFRERQTPKGAAPWMLRQGKG